MNFNELYFLDIDETILHVDSKVRVINKRNPNKVLAYLDYLEYYNIIDNKYVDDNIKIFYNNDVFYISQVLFDKISKYNPNIKASDLGMSFVEFTDEFIDKTSDNITFLKDNYKHLENKQVILLTARSNKHKSEGVLKLIKEELDKYNISIYKDYFVGDYSNVTTAQVPYKKATIILEHLIGYKIDYNKFTEKLQDTCEAAYFYDDNENNINTANDIQNILDSILHNTKDDEIHNNIIYRIKTNKLCMINNLVGSNKLNRFKTTEIDIKTPVKYGLNENLQNIKSFYNFNR